MTATDLIAGPYTLPRQTRGKVYDELKKKWVKVTAAKLTTFGGWPAVGRDQARPIVDAELLRAIGTEAATAVAHHWRVNISTAVRWRLRAGIVDPRATVPGTVALYRDQAASKIGTESARYALAVSLGHYTPTEDSLLVADPRAAVELLGRTEKAIRCRRSRLGAAGETGRPAEVLAGRYGCWEIIGATAHRSPTGEIVWSIRCRCGATAARATSKIKRSPTRCRMCP